MIDPRLLPPLLAKESQLIVPGSAWFGEWGIFVVAVVASAAAYFLTGLLAPSLFKTYTQLGTEERAEWCSRVVSNLHAAVACYGGWVCLRDVGWTSDMDAAFGLGRDRHLFLSLTMGYLAYDLGPCLRHRRSFGDPLTLAHHSVILVAFALGMRLRFGTFYMFTFLGNEASTFFVNQRWFLLQMGQRKSPSYGANMAATAASFLAVRVLFNGAVVLHMLRTWGRLWVAVVLVIPWQMKATLGLLTTLSWAHYAINAVWFYQICRKIRAMRREGNRQGQRPPEKAL